MNAVHYLVKPFSQGQFDEALERTIDLFKAKPKGGTATIVDIAKIIYIESLGHNRYVHTVKGVLTECQRTLARFLDELGSLSAGQFISPYRGYIINLAAVRTITPKSIQMNDGTDILIKPGDFRTLKEKWFKYVFGK